MVPGAGIVRDGWSVLGLKQINKLQTAPGQMVAEMVADLVADLVAET